MVEVTEDLSNHEKMVLAASCTRISKGTRRFTERSVPQVQRIHGRDSREANASRGVTDYLKAMSKPGLLTWKDAYSGSGKPGYTYELNKLDHNVIVQMLVGEAVTTSDGQQVLMPSALKSRFEEEGRLPSISTSGMKRWGCLLVRLVCDSGGGGMSGIKQ